MPATIRTSAAPRIRRPLRHNAEWKRIREERAELWAALVRDELSKLERRGEAIRPELLEWAWRLF